MFYWPPPGHFDPKFAICDEVEANLNIKLSYVLKEHLKCGFYMVFQMSLVANFVSQIQW